MSSGARRRKARPYGQAFLLAVVLGWSVFFIPSVSRYGERQEKEDISSNAATAAAALDVQAVMSLKGSAEDNGTPALRSVRESLARVRQVNPEARFVYLMREQDGHLIFLADAEPENSRDYSPPGQVYNEQDAGASAVLRTGKAIVEDPYTDSWGAWVSALAPVTEKPGAAPVAVLGMDVSTRRWARQVTRYQIFAGTICALFLGLVLLAQRNQRRQQRDNEMQEQLNERLEAELAERRVLEERLQQMASLDSLTSIPNRRIFDDVMRREWGRALREGRTISLVMADLDFFKNYNDRYGHIAGDECLRRVAGALASCAYRPTDPVARYGGEEFGVILPDVDLAGAAEIAVRVVAAVRDLKLPHLDSEVADIVTISAGHATLVPTPDQTPRDLIMLADAALYEAKRSGRNCVRASRAPANTTEA